VPGCWEIVRLSGPGALRSGTYYVHDRTALLH